MATITNDNNNNNNNNINTNVFGSNVSNDTAITTTANLNGKSSNNKNNTPPIMKAPISNMSAYAPDFVPYGSISKATQGAIHHTNSVVDKYNLIKQQSLLVNGNMKDNFNHKKHDTKAPPPKYPPGHQKRVNRYENNYYARTQQKQLYNRNHNHRNMSRRGRGGRGPRGRGRNHRNFQQFNSNMNRIERREKHYNGKGYGMSQQPNRRKSFKDAASQGTKRRIDLFEDSKANEMEPMYKKTRSNTPHPSQNDRNGGNVNADIDNDDDDDDDNDDDDMGDHNYNDHNKGTNPSKEEDLQKRKKIEYAHRCVARKQKVLESISLQWFYDRCTNSHYHDKDPQFLSKSLVNTLLKQQPPSKAIKCEMIYTGIDPSLAMAPLAQLQHFFELNKEYQAGEVTYNNLFFNKDSNDHSGTSPCAPNKLWLELNENDIHSIKLIDPKPWWTKQLKLAREKHCVPFFNVMRELKWKACIRLLRRGQTGSTLLAIKSIKVIAKGKEETTVVGVPPLTTKGNEKAKIYKTAFELGDELINDHGWLQSHLSDMANSREKCKQFEKERIDLIKSLNEIRQLIVYYYNEKETLKRNNNGSPTIIREISRFQTSLNELRGEDDKLSRILKLPQYNSIPNHDFIDIIDKICQPQAKAIGLELKESDDSDNNSEDYSDLKYVLSKELASKEYNHSKFIQILPNLDKQLSDFIATSNKSDRLKKLICARRINKRNWAIANGFLNTEEEKKHDELKVDKLMSFKSSKVKIDNYDMHLNYREYLSSFYKAKGDSYLEKTTRSFCRNNLDATLPNVSWTSKDLKSISETASNAFVDGNDDVVTMEYRNAPHLKIIFHNESPFILKNKEDWHKKLAKNFKSKNIFGSRTKLIFHKVVETYSVTLDAPRNEFDLKKNYQGAIDSILYLLNNGQHHVNENSRLNPKHLIEIKRMNKFNKNKLLLIFQGSKPSSLPKYLGYAQWKRYIYNADIEPSEDEKLAKLIPMCNTCGMYLHRSGSNCKEYLRQRKAYIISVDKMQVSDKKKQNLKNNWKPKKKYCYRCGLMGHNPSQCSAALMCTNCETDRDCKNAGHEGHDHGTVKDVNKCEKLKQYVSILKDYLHYFIAGLSNKQRHPPLPHSSTIPDRVSGVWYSQDKIKDFKEFGVNIDIQKVMSKEEFKKRLKSNTLPGNVSDLFDDFGNIAVDSNRIIIDSSCIMSEKEMNQRNLIPYLNDEGDGFLVPANPKKRRRKGNKSGNNNNKKNNNNNNNNNNKNISNENNNINDDSFVSEYSNSTRGVSDNRQKSNEKESNDDTVLMEMDSDDGDDEDDSSHSMDSVDDRSRKKLRKLQTHQQSPQQQLQQQQQLLGQANIAMIDATASELNQIGSVLDTTSQITNESNFNNNVEFGKSMNNNKNNRNNKDNRNIKDNKNRNNKDNKSNEKMPRTAKQQQEEQQRRIQQHQTRAKKEASDKSKNTNPNMKPNTTKKKKNKTSNNTNLGTTTVVKTTTKTDKKRATKILASVNKQVKNQNQSQQGQQPPTTPLVSSKVKVPVHKPRGHGGPRSSTSGTPHDRGRTSNK